MSDCVFCGIATGTVRSWVVDQDEWTVSFLDASQVTEGHTLVIQRRHADDIWDIPAEDMQQVAAAVHWVARLLRARLNPPGMTLFQANRTAGWQDIFHLHVHVVPRYLGDPPVVPWRLQKSPSDVMDRTLATIRASN